MTEPTELQQIRRSLENIEGLLSDYFSAQALGERSKYDVYKQKREARKRRRAGGSHTAAEWKALKRRYGYTCLKCKRVEPEIKLTRDHIDPEGTDDIENVQPLCEACNQDKGNQVIDYRPAWDKDNEH